MWLILYCHVPNPVSYFQGHHTVRSLHCNNSHSRKFHTLYTVILIVMYFASAAKLDTARLRPMSHLRQSRKCDRACRTSRHGTSHSLATRFRHGTLFYSVRLWHASESRASKTCDKIAGVTSVLRPRDFTQRGTRQRVAELKRWSSTPLCVASQWLTSLGHKSRRIQHTCSVNHDVIHKTGSL